MIDTLGREIIPPLYEDIISHGNNDDSDSWGFAEDDNFEGFVEIFSPTITAVLKDGKWGVVDSLGKELIPPAYKEIRELSEGLFMVKKDTAGKYGLIDIQGKEITPFIYKDFQGFSQGKFIVKQDTAGKFGLIDILGKEVSPLIYEDIREFSQGLFRARKDTTGKWGLVDTRGKELTPFIYEDFRRFSRVILKVKNTDGKWGLIDTLGNEIIPPTYQKIGSYVEFDFEKVSRDRAWVEKEGKMGPHRYIRQRDCFLRSIGISWNFRKVGIGLKRIH